MYYVIHVAFPNKYKSANELNLNFLEYRTPRDTSLIRTIRKCFRVHKPVVIRTTRLGQLCNMYLTYYYINVF